MKHKWIWITLIVIAVLAVVSFIATGAIFVNFAFKRMVEIPEVMMPGDGEDEATRNRMKIIKANRKIFNDMMPSWLEEVGPEKVSVETPDGLTLRGKFIKSENESHKYVILVHGYQGKGEWMLPFGYVYHGWDYNVLLPDLRAHGESDGKWIGMGYLDKDDIFLWCDLITKMDPEAEIVLHGISMGGATVMSASGDENRPGNVVAIIEDCGFTDVWDVFATQIKEVHGLPGGPMMAAANIVGRPLLGYWLSDAKAIESVKKADPELPMFFVQGRNDSFVPVRMLEESYAAKRGTKEKLIVEDCDHGNSYCREPELYFNSVKAFLDKYVN